MSEQWDLIPLNEALVERHESPDTDAIAAGDIPIVSKISFASGQIEFRSDGKTRTGMIGIQPGDLVVSGINAAKGAIGLYSEKQRTPAAATIHYGSYSVRDDRADSKFIWWLLRSNSFRDILARHLPGGIKTELKAKRLLPIPVLLPPVEEQRRIVVIIERLAGQIANACQLRHESERHTEAILSVALNRFSRRCGQLKTLETVLSGKPRNGWSPRCDNSEGGTPVLTLSAVTGFTYDPIAYKRTSLPTDPDAHYWLQAGDLLITRSNSPELVGHAAIYSGEPSPCIYPDLIMRVSLNEKLTDNMFAWYWLQTPIVRDYIADHARGTNPTMRKITQGIVMDIPYPVELSLDQQRHAVKMFNKISGKVHAIRTQQQQTAPELDALMPSILDKAFRGEL